ncbi:unnamed protein product, partial [Prorocentrum cordatum]
MVGPTTFMELFHTLLDLPLTAAFMEQYDRPEESAETQWSRLGLDRLSPAFKAVQHYVMRNESGLGGVCVWETRDEAQLSMIRTLWNSLPVTPRVSSVGWAAESRALQSSTSKVSPWSSCGGRGAA